jgi:hypothetical protein
VSQEYDDTNKGVAFGAYPDASLLFQGKLDHEGREARCVVVLQKLSRDKPPVPVLYREVGPLFEHDKKGNEKAPDRSGPAEGLAPGWRVAAWKRSSDKAGNFISLSLSPPREDAGLEGARPQQAQPQSQTFDPHAMDDEIPF